MFGTDGLAFACAKAEFEALPIIDQTIGAGAPEERAAFLRALRSTPV